MEYLRALERRDRNAILKLVPHDHAASAEVDERIWRFGGAHAAEADVRITADISPYVVGVSIQTAGDGARALAWTENFFWRDGAWWLVLGGKPDRPLSRTERPGP
jgi:hypothetical protein